MRVPNLKLGGENIGGPIQFNDSTLAPNRTSADHNCKWEEAIVLLN